MRDRIIQTGMEYISKYGFRKFTVDDIASDLGISKKTVYKYFESKKEIISAVVETYIEMEKKYVLDVVETNGRWLDKLNVVLCGCTHDKVQDWLMDELQRFFPDEWVKVEAIREFKKKQVKELLSQGINNGNIRPDFHPVILDLIFAKTIGAFLDYSFLTQNDLTINKAMEELRKIVFYGILKRD